MKLASRTVLMAAIATTLAASAVADARSHKQASVEAAMRAMDTNRDGKISTGEYAAGAQEVFQSLDGNQDSRVAASEMDEAQRPMQAVDASHVERNSKVRREISAAERIQSLDTDGDGVLSGDEYADGAFRMFARMDTNKDGYLTSDEISAATRR